MAYCFYNGAKLPELPSDTLASYPYCWIRKNDNTKHYDLIFTKVLGYYDATAGGIVYGANEGTAEIVHYRVAFADADSAGDWDNYQTTNTWMALDANRTVMWANHYIPNGSLTAAEMYFYASEAIPDVEVYQIEKGTVVGIADQVRRLCKTEDTMTPAQMESNLGDLNIELEEAYVTSTEKEQVIYPDQGYYGFSKITVGGVSFGGGGGYLPDADNSGFGDNYIPEEDGGEVNTGNFFYGTSDTAFPAIPYYPETPYAIVYTENWRHYEGSEMVTTEETFVTLTAAPLVFNGYSIEGYAHLLYGKSSTNLGNGRVFRDFMAESGGWKFQAEWINSSIYAKKILWVNYTITLKDEVTPWHPEDSDPVPEKKPGTQAVPVEYAESYEISGSSVYALASVTQKITGNTDPMTPTGAATALEDYYAQPKAEEVLW